MATMANFRVPDVQNEPNKHYAKGTPERQNLTDALKAMKQRMPLEVPAVIGGRPIHSNSSTRHTQLNPSSHSTTVATYSHASTSDVSVAIDAALTAKPEWENLPFAERAAVFLKAADLIAGKYRGEIMAATMLGQGKNAWQAEIDSAAETCDFLRFNVKYAQDTYGHQPVHNSPGVWNRVEYRPLEGFVYAITPFNFTAIAANLPCAPALMGNVVVWKPSPSAMASNWLLYQILLEAGLPPNVIQFVPGDAVEVTKAVLAHRELAALHYTGSTAVFRTLYGQIATGVAEGRYQGYPRIVGETGGKNFHLVHHTADVHNSVINTVRGAFEYQGQKCSATSRAYFPSSLWDTARTLLVSETSALKVGPPEDYGNFIGPVIHEASFNKLSKAIVDAKNDPELELLVGGTYDKSEGYYIHPTIYQTTNPNHPLMSTELFGPILCIYVYEDGTTSSPSPPSSPSPSSSPNTTASTLLLTNSTPDTQTQLTALRSICKTIDTTSSYALTGSIFATSRTAILAAQSALRNSAGNFYINCKSTGAVVGQQPFGGARASGTNDKAGSANLLSRFVSMRAVKEEFLELNGVAYPSNEV